MSVNWGVTDILAVAKLAWDLYHKCYLVARDAPDEFRQLVNELASLQSVLRTVRDDINSDVSFLQKLGESRKESLERCLSGCFETLRRLQDLVIKYRKLGSDQSMQFWKKIKWIAEQKSITDVKARIMVHTCNISLCMTSIGNSSLARIEGRLEEALNQTLNADEFDEEAPLNRHRSTPDHRLAGGTQGHTIGRSQTESTLIDSEGRGEVTPSSSEEGTSDFDTTKPYVPKRTGKIAPGLRQGSITNSEVDSSALPPSPRASDEYSVSRRKSDSSQGRYAASEMSILLANNNAGAGTAENNKQIVYAAVADAKRELLTIIQREQSSRPLKVPQQDPKRTPDPSLSAIFQKYADDELQIRRLNARDWLRVATWWLLKAQNHMQAVVEPDFTSSRGSLSVPGDGRSPANQAYVDLLKASWILHTMILREENAASLLTDENRKLFHDLSDGIKNEFNLYQPVDTPENETFLKQNCDIWEHLQPEEEKLDDDDFLLGMENGRWITVEQEDSGDESEKVLFRTFVNAAIGSRRVRIMSKGAAYMLILSTREGESEPRVTLCNQSGTLCLTRDFTIKDLQEDCTIDPFATAPQLGAPEAIPLTFGRMNTVIAFTNILDLQQFMSIPRAYFEAVKKREPRRLEKATESLIFKRSVEIYERFNASTLKRMEPPEQFHSCDLRVLETTNQEGWQTTRRLVVSSSAGEKTPWLVESFLPLSGVQIQRDVLSRQMLVRWSDCRNEVLSTDGSYNKVWSYFYDDSNPNIAIHLSFRNVGDATDFEQKVLQLSSTPIFSWSTSLVSGFVYTVSDADPHPRTYKALLLTHTRQRWKSSEVFYMYRDTDYQYDHASTCVRFPQAMYPHYISSHVDKLFKPAVNETPQFLRCEKRVGNVLVEFVDELTCMEFMSSLSSQHRLIFSRRVHYIRTKAPPRFGSAKSNKGNAEVQLWEKGNSIRLLSRWGDHVVDKWITMAMPKTGVDHVKDSNRATFPKLEYDRGRKIDMANLMARDSKEKVEGKKVAHLTIAFNTVRDREEFAAALHGTTPLVSQGPFHDLMMM